MRATLKSNPPLRRLLAAWLQSCVGTGAGYVALLFVAIHDLGSGWAVMGVLLADFMPAIAFGVFFGALADRYSRRMLIVVANVIQAGAWGGLVVSRTAVPVLALALAAGMGNALAHPAMRSALPTVAGEARQVAAAWFDTCRWVGITAGPVLSAGLFGVTGVGLPLALNGASFLIAALVIGGLDIDRPAQEESASEAPGAGVRAGLAVAFEAPGIAAVVACSAAGVVSAGLVNVCEPLLATTVLHGSGSDYALLVACFGVGMVVGSVLVARRGDPSGTTIIRRYLASLALCGLGIGGSAVVGSIAPATITFAATGYANALWVVSETQLIQLRVPNSVQGRLFGARNTIEGVAFLVGLVGAGAMVATEGVRLTLAAGAALYGLCTLAALIALRTSLRDRPAIPTPFDYETCDPPLFADALAYAQPTRRFDPVVAASALADPADRAVPASPPAT